MRLLSAWHDHGRCRTAGTVTDLAQLIAEELACDWDSIGWEFATPAQSLSRGRPWGSFSTGGSRGIRNSQQYVREGGALARQLLLAAAAQRWQVPIDECQAHNSIITHGPSGRTVPFGDVAELASTLPAPATVTLKQPKEWQVIGRSVKRLDTTEKVTGQLRYAADIKLPGMLQAAISACPVHGGKRGKVDADKAITMPGIKKIVMVSDDAVAVVADHWWQAKQALDTIAIEWLTGPSGQVDSDSIHAMLRDGLTATDTFIGHNKGDAQSALGKTNGLVSADYSYPFQNHAPMEPMNATVLWTPSRCAGSFVYGLSAALYSELTVKEGRVEQENFDTYPSMRLAAMPEVETTVMPSGGFWGGVGEPTIAVGAPAVLNGIYAASGVRIRHLPLKNQALS